jgi:hypothetical protein
MVSENLVLEDISVHNTDPNLAAGLDITQIGIDGDRFNLELFDPNKSLTSKQLKSLEKAFASDGEKTGDDYSVTGYPAWGAASVVDDLMILPTLQPDFDYSYQYFLLEAHDGVYEIIAFVSAQSSENPAQTIGSLTVPLLNEAMVGDEYISVQFQEIGYGYLDDQGGEVDALTDCIWVTMRSLECISAHSGDESLCCRCEEVEDNALHCTESGGGGGGGGGGGTINGGNNCIGCGWSDPFAMWWENYLATAEDKIEVDIDCDAQPCLCAAVNRFLEAGELTSSNQLSSTISSMILDLYEEENLINLEITTSTAEGIIMQPNILATHDASGTQMPRSLRSTITFNTNSALGLNCTQAYLSSTLIHESMHAYIKSQMTFLTEAQFNARYPLFSTSLTSTDENYAHHVVLANSYVDLMAESLQGIYPEMSISLAIDLSWVGLQGTPAFNAMIAADPDRLIEIIASKNAASFIGNPIHPAELDRMGLEPCL